VQEQQSIPLAGPRITRITLGRLHNLGNYEHVRYEVTVELPPGTSPSSVARELEDTLNDLEPKCPVGQYELREAMKLVAQPEPTLRPRAAHDYDEHWGDTPQQVLERELNAREAARRLIARHEEWRKTREAALQRFDQFGGSSLWTDAKGKWDDGDDF